MRAVIKIRPLGWRKVVSEIKTSDRLDSVVLLLTFLILIFVGVLLWTAVFLKSDGQTFQIVASLVTGFSGALLMRIKPKGAGPDDPVIPMPSAPSKVTVEAGDVKDAVEDKGDK